MKQLAIALHSMHDAYGQFPGDVGWFAGEKNPPISWRVSILPFIEQDNLYTPEPSWISSGTPRSTTVLYSGS